MLWYGLFSRVISVWFTIFVPLAKGFFSYKKYALHTVGKMLSIRWKHGAPAFTGSLKRISLEVGRLLSSLNNNNNSKID